MVIDKTKTTQHLKKGAQHSKIDGYHNYTALLVSAVQGSACRTSSGQVKDFERITEQH